MMKGDELSRMVRVLTKKAVILGIVYMRAKEEKTCLGLNT
jgi:hypothetical protein